MHFNNNQIILNVFFSFNRFTGSGIGTLTFGPVLQYILQRYGLAISLRILSGVTLLLLVVALTYKPFRSPLEELFEVKRQPATFFDLSIWQNKAFCVYTAAVALFMLGYFIPYVHLVGSPHCFIPIPLGAPIVLFPPFLWEQPSFCLRHLGAAIVFSLSSPGNSHRFVSSLPLLKQPSFYLLPLGAAIVLSPSPREQLPHEK